MGEYALLRDGEIINVVTTYKSLGDMEEQYSDFEVKPLDAVPDEVKERYRYWSERP